MNCPVCDERLREVEKHGVTVDICPACKGVWLDRGELDKIIEFAETGNIRSEAEPSVDRSREREYDREHDQRDRDERRGHDRDYERREGGERKRRGSWLGDILGGFGGDE